MLATGKRWQGAEDFLRHNKISADLAKDFIDYFIFGGSGSKMARELGITDLSLRYDEKASGVRVKKRVSDKTEVSYAVEKNQHTEGNSSITHKTGGEYRITEGVFLEGEKEIKKNHSEKEADSKEKTDDKLLLKYKKEF